MVLSRFMGEKKVFQAANEMLEDPNNEIAKTVPIEFLNGITTSGLPPARLELKLGCPLMILRNLAPEQGVCNGTRTILTRMSRRVLEVRLMSGDHVGETVFIPRIKLSPSKNDLPFQFH